MTKTALIVKWNHVTWGYNARPVGISVHCDETAMHDFMAENAFGFGDNFFAPDPRVGLIDVADKTPLARLFGAKKSVYFSDGTDDFAYRQALAMVPIERQRLDYDRFIVGGVDFVRQHAQCHESDYRKSGYRSEPNWGVFAL